MSEKTFTLATTNFNVTDRKKLRYVYLDFLLEDNDKNNKLLLSTSIELKIQVDKNSTEKYNFAPKALGYQKKKIPIKYTQQGIWVTITITTEYDFVFENISCLFSSKMRRD